MSTEQAARGWWRTMIAHRPVEVDPIRPPECPLCGVRKCPPRAEAFTSLVVTDRWLDGPPPEIDRPHPTAGATRRTA